MKYILLLFTLCLSTWSYSQQFGAKVYNSYNEAQEESVEKQKPMFIYLGNHSDEILTQIIKNDTLHSVLANDFVNLYNPQGRVKRYLKDRYDAKKSKILLINSDETLHQKYLHEDVNSIISDLEPLSESTFYYYSQEYKQKFNQIDSSAIFEEIETVYLHSSAVNARLLTIDYLKEQSSLLTPVNYQLMKTLLPIGDKDLIYRFLDEMRPEMYTREMAEKVAYELLTVNDFAIEETRAIIAQYDIPFEEEVDLYLTLHESTSFKQKKENCFEFVLEATSYDYESLANCFVYILRNGNQKQIKELELKYMFTFNEVPLDRSLLYGQLLGELFLRQGKFDKFVILQKRNEQLTDKFIKKE